MKAPIRRPEQILAYRTLAEILGPNARTIWSVAPTDSVQTAVQLMAEKDIGLVLVLDRQALVGVLSERDCARRMIGVGRPAEHTQVSEIMASRVFTVELTETFAECLRLMHENRIRHLPVMRAAKVVAVISVRDLLGEAVEHHRRIINELEQERMTMFTSTA